MKTRRSQEMRLAVCITASEPDLNLGKIYQVLPDKSAAKDRYFRIIDESGEAYLYPAQFFVLIKLPQEAERALARVS